MKIIIIGGFLGSGKTTLLLQMIGKLKNLVVLENDVAKNSVDAGLIRQKGFPVKEMTAGCICCSLSGSLKDTLKEIREEYHPEYLLIEATGMAVPAQVREGLAGGVLPGETVRQITLCDSSRFDEMQKFIGPLLNRQLEGADLLLLTKADLCREPEEFRKKMEQKAPEVMLLNLSKELTREQWEKIL